MNIFVKTINRSFGFGRFAQKRRFVCVTLLIWVKVTNVLMAQFLQGSILFKSPAANRRKSVYFLMETKQ